MRIVVVDRPTFRELWNKMMPANRLLFNLGCSHVYDASLNLLTVVDEDVQVVELPEYDGDVTLERFRSQVVNPEYKVLP